MHTHSKFFAALILLLCFTFTAFAQVSESDKIPPTVKAQIVRRILTWYFKPQNRTKVITVAAADVEKAWLPEIKGVEFRLVTEKAAVESNESVYVFREFDKLKNGTHEIGFGYGSAGGGYSGDTWAFRVSRRNVNLWKQRNAGWGSSGIDYGDPRDN